jgi:hypothetical protein
MIMHIIVDMFLNGYVLACRAGQIGKARWRAALGD